jgi:PAS domain S-box-containing protein
MKILIVDDHEVVRRGVSSLLRKNQGYQICGEAADGKDAIQRACELNPQVIVMDITMPNINGLEATRAIRELLPDAEVLIMSQHDSPQVVQQAFRAGARGYVVKSSLARELLNAVAVVGRHEVFVDPQISSVRIPESQVDVPLELQRGTSAPDTLRESYEKYRSLINPTGQLIWRCDAKGENLWTSETLTSVAADEVKRFGWLALVHPDDRQRAAEAWAQCVRAGIPFCDEFRGQTPDGNYHHFESRAVPVKDKTGKILEWVGTNIDVTERKLVESALRASDERMRFILEAAKFGTWDWNIKSGEVQWSDNMEEVHGQPRGSFGGNFEAFLQGVHDEDRALVLNRIDQAMSGDGNYHVEYRQRRSDGSPAWMESMGRVVYDEEHQPVRMMGVCMEITQRKETEAALRSAQSDLEKRVQERTADLELAQASLRHLSARLLQAQDEERRRIARELHDSAGQLLAALSMTLTPLELELPKANPRWAESLQSSMKLVDELSKELRTISHLLHPPMLDEAGLEFALRWYVEGFAERSRINVHFDFPQGLERLPREVETTIFRLIQESLTNIHRHAESPTAAIRVWRENGEIKVEIRDHGKGMPADVHQGLSRRVRTGLGIQGMRERVRELGGRLEIHSGRAGTAVIAAVPFQQRDADANAARSVNLAN